MKRPPSLAATAAALLAAGPACAAGPPPAPAPPPTLPYLAATDAAPAPAPPAGVARVECDPAAAVAGPVPVCLTPEEVERLGDAHPHSEIGPPYHYDRVFRPPALGDLMHATMARQVSNGEAALLILHRTDFAPGAADLNPHGLRRLAWIAGRLPRCSRPVLVEPPAAWEPGGAGLGEARRAAVAALLAGGAFPVPAERVVLAPDPAAGMEGTDAELVYRNLLILTGSGGKLRTRFDVFGNAAQSATAAPANNPTAAGAPR